MSSVKYPYRDPVPRDYSLDEFVSGLRVSSTPVDDGVDHFFDDIIIEKTDISDMPDAYMGKAGALRRLAEADLARDTVPGVVGGLCVEKSSCASYVNKNNYNPPTSDLQLISSVLDGSCSHIDCEFSPPVPITLRGVRKWCETHTQKDEWTRKDGSLGEAPDCTIGVFRRRLDGKIAGFVPCGSWNCQTCGPIKRDRLIDKVTGAFGDDQTYFLTLNLRVPVGKWTVHDKNPLRVDGYHIEGYYPQAKIASCFQRFRSILHKKGYFTGATGPVKSITSYVNKFGTACTRTTRERLRGDQSYFYVKEFSPPAHVYSDHSGRVTAGHRRHYHIMTNFSIPEAVIRDAWYYATNKTSTNVKFVSETEEFGAIRARYIAKYINKSMPDSSFLTHYLPKERRYGKSVGFFTMKFSSLGTCFFQRLVVPDPSTHSGNELWSDLYDIVLADPDPPFYYSRQHPLS